MVDNPNMKRVVGVFFVLTLLLFPLVLMNSVRPTKLSGAVEARRVSGDTLEERWIKDYVKLFEEEYSDFVMEGHTLGDKNVMYCNSTIEKYIRVENGHIFDNKYEILVGEDIIRAFNKAGMDISTGSDVDVTIKHYIVNNTESDWILNHSDDYTLKISGIIPESMGDLSNLIVLPYELGDMDDYESFRYMIEPNDEITIKGAGEYLRKEGAVVIGGGNQLDYQMFRMYMVLSLSFAIMFSIVMLILIESLNKDEDIKKLIVTRIWGGEVKMFLMDEFKKKSIYITASAFGAYLLVSGFCLFLFPYLNRTFRHIFFKLEIFSANLLFIVLISALIIVAFDIISLNYRINRINLTEYIREGWKR